MIKIENQTGKTQTIGIIHGSNKDKVKIIAVANNTVQSYPEYIFDLHIVIKKFDEKDFQ